MSGFLAQINALCRSTNAQTCLRRVTKPFRDLPKNTSNPRAGGPESQDAPKRRPRQAKRPPRGHQRRPRKRPRAPKRRPREAPRRPRGAKNPSKIEVGDFPERNFSYSQAGLPWCTFQIAVGSIFLCFVAHERSGRHAFRIGFSNTKRLSGRVRIACVRARTNLEKHSPGGSKTRPGGSKNTFRASEIRPQMHNKPAKSDMKGSKT